MKKPPKYSPLGLAALAMLFEAPMHPYRMQRLIKERGKDEVINVTQRAGLYQTIGRLEREGLIRSQPVRREQNRPERTVYEITEIGRTTALEWMRRVLSTPTREFPDFPAAVSSLALLTPEDARRQMELRLPRIQAEIDRINKVLKLAARVPRLFLLEMEFLRATQVTELSWVKSVIKDLRSQRLTWSEAWMRKVVARLAKAGAPGVNGNE
jgi:DNA-binding PadR family transcriptional regulator